MLCLCACIYVCMYVCVYIYIYICTYVCVCVYVCIYVCMYVCMYREHNIKESYTLFFVYAQYVMSVACEGLDAIFVCMHTCMYVCMYVCLHDAIDRKRNLHSALCVRAVCHVCSLQGARCLRLLVPVASMYPMAKKYMPAHVYVCMCVYIYIYICVCIFASTV